MITGDRIQKKTTQSLSQQGIILFSTVCMIALLSLLVLSQLQLFFLEFKAFNQVARQNKTLKNIESVSKKLLADTGVWSKKCLIQAMNSPLLIEKLQANEGCLYRENGIDYQYVIENLGMFPCLQSRVNAVLYSTQHWRFTIIEKTTNQLTLQLRVATLKAYLACETGEVSLIKPGIISWRYIMAVPPALR